MIRRHFGFVTAALASFGFGRVDAAARAGNSAFDAELRRVFSRPADAAEVGRRYLIAYPAKTSRQALLADLLETHSACQRHSNSPRHLFAQWQQRDFRDGAVVQVDGWILARTEVALCALLYLGQRT